MRSSVSRWANEAAGSTDSREKARKSRPDFIVGRFRMIS